MSTFKVIKYIRNFIIIVILIIIGGFIVDSCEFSYM